MHWDWLPQYVPALLHGLGMTLFILVFSVIVGFVLAVTLALTQIRGSFLARSIVGAFCSYIRGTPLLMQLYLLYYGLGSLFPLIPGAREDLQWLLRLDAIYYVLLAFTLSFAGYEAEVMRGAFLAVPHGEIEAAEAIGMSRLQVLRRIWLPSAINKVLPTLAGEVISQLKATPIAFTVPVMDLMSVIKQVRQDTYLTYEPLLFVAAVYLLLTWFITLGFGRLERRVPTRMVR